MSQLKIISVNYHRNGSAGTGFHVVRFDEGRGKTKRRLVGVVFPERRSVAVLDVDLLNERFAENRLDAPEYEDELREAVRVYERGRVKNLAFGRRLARSRGVERVIDVEQVVKSGIDWLCEKL